MANTECAYCTYMDVTKEREGKFYCEKDRYYHFADEINSRNCHCPRWRKDMYLGDDAIKTSREWKRAHGGTSSSSSNLSGCFITTIVVNILGLDDNCEVLETLRKFRNNVLQKDEDFRELLMKYDVIGPKIAKILSTLDNKEEVAAEIYFDYLIPCIDAIKAGEYEQAVSVYTDMTNILASKYLSKENLQISENVYNAYDHSRGGHGRLALTTL